MSDDTKTELPNIYWLGGSSGAGKTTIAQLIAENYGYELYSTDSAMGDHALRCSATDCRQLEKFREMTMDELLNKCNFCERSLDFKSEIISLCDAKTLIK